MTWNYFYGCGNGCTWQETAIVCLLAVLTTVVFLAWVCWMARKHEKLEKCDEGITQQRLKALRNQ